jgi:hypothetical protein
VIILAVEQCYRNCFIDRYDLCVTQGGRKQLPKIVKRCLHAPLSRTPLGDKDRSRIDNLLTFTRPLAISWNHLRVAAPQAGLKCGFPSYDGELHRAFRASLLIEQTGRHQLAARCQIGW